MSHKRPILKRFYEKEKSMRYWLFLLLFLCFCNLCVAQGKKCSVPKETGGKYKLVVEDYASSIPREVHLEVVIKPENFTEEYLTEFRKRIKAKYCNPDYIFAVIFDNEEAAVKRYDSITTKMNSWRGLYVFDKPMDTDRIEFSTKPGNSNKEIVINFNKPVLD